MTVFDNLQNYDIPAGFRLSLEQEEELAAIVADIVTELDKRKTNKLETRKYFKTHLRYSSNVLDDNADKGKAQDQYEEGESYTPLEGEYTWPSKILHPVLLSVLRVEKFKFGYIINLILDDMEARGEEAPKNVWKVSDSVIQFVQEFDFESLKTEVSKINDIRQRIVFLRSKMTDMVATDILSFSEKEEWTQEYYLKVEALLKLEEKRLELYPSGYEMPMPAPATEPEKTEKKDYHSLVYNYCKDDNVAYEESYQLILKGINFEQPTIEKTVVEEMFAFVDREFGRFLESCEVLSIDKITDIFFLIDHWYEHFKESVDAAYTQTQQAIKVSVRKKTTKEKREDLEERALIYARFIVERAIIAVSGLKANILYNHRYVDEVYYNISGGTFEEFMAERERLEGHFGGGDERDVMFDQGACIEAFYDQIVEIAKFGLLEVSHESESMDDEERLSLYRGRLKAVVDFGLPFYIDLVKTHPDISTEIYHEALSWVETTYYCFFSVMVAVELWAMTDEDRITLFDPSYFQKVNFDYIPQLLEEALQEYKSDTGNYSIDDELNDLGERDADEWDSVVPLFDPEIITDDFIPEEEYDKAMDTIEREDYKQNGVPVKLPPIPKMEGGPYTYVVKGDHEPPSSSPHILLKGKESEIIQYINEHIDRDVPTNAICLLLAARELGYTGKLTHSVAVELFGKFSSRSTYNSYYNGARTVDSSVVATYKTALEKHFKSPPSSPE